MINFRKGDLYILNNSADNGTYRGTFLEILETLENGKVKCKWHKCGTISQRYPNCFNKAVELICHCCKDKDCVTLREDWQE